MLMLLKYKFTHQSLSGVRSNTCFDGGTAVERQTTVTSHGHVINNFISVWVSMVSLCKSRKMFDNAGSLNCLAEQQQQRQTSVKN